MSRKLFRSKYQPTLPHFHKTVISLGLLLLFSVSTFGQDKDKADLQKERDRISQEISLTNKLLLETKSNRDKMESELGLLNRKIRLREDLIRSLRGEITSYNRKIKGNKGQIDELEDELKTLKGSYAKAVRFAQRTARSQDRLLYIFASADFFQAIRRIRYLQQYSKHRLKQARQISETQDKLNELNASLLSVIGEKDALLSNEEATKKELSADVAQQKTLVSGLQQEESKLKKKLRQQEKQRESLNKEIQRIIEEEIRASKKTNSGVFALTPESAALSANFEKNQGKLPWPVERGVITSKFGKNPHPVLAGITVPNNGVDIATNANSSVRAIFDGTVSAVFNISGAGQNVIISHGGYRSVYTNLREVHVAKGQKVSAKDPIGKVLTDEASGKTEAHLEIWKVGSDGTTTKQDPALWIYRQ